MRETPEAILLVEFGDDDHETNLRMLQQLKDLMGDLGFGWDKNGAQMGWRGRSPQSGIAGCDH